MIVTKTPLRLPLAGGLTDLEPYASRFGGVTVSTTIDKYVYVAVKHSWRGAFDLRYLDEHERSSTSEGIRHERTRAALGVAELTGTPLDIAILADLPPGSGLGSSGAVTVGLLHAMHELQGASPSRERLLREAAAIEVDALAGASGYHDPAICALGGLRRLEYDGDGAHAAPLEIPVDALQAFEASLMLFYSGRRARTKPSLDLLVRHLDEALPVLHDIATIGRELAAALEDGSIPRAAERIGMMQELKQRLPGHFVDAYVRDVVARVRATGAQPQIPGGKISGFVLVCCPHGQQEAVREALHDLREVPFRFERGGTVATSV